MSLKRKKIIVGVTGGIAAYKICELVRAFKKEQAEVKVIMTPSACHFVSPLTLSVLSGNDVLINLFPDDNKNEPENVSLKTEHVYSGIWADVMIIAPATANTIAKIAMGISDDLLTTTVLSARCKIIIAPSMDEDMYNNEITQSNIDKLRNSGYLIMDPEKGELASGLSGLGRMPEPLAIFEHAKKVLNGSYKDLTGKKVLITAGPTYENIDRVRFIGNYSSGKMGFALAKAAMFRGADVTLVSGPSTLITPRHVKRIEVISADEMFNAVKDNMNSADYIIMSAAVADYKPVSPKKNKIKKTEDILSIDLEKTVDILSYLGKNKKRYKLAGFALETDDLQKYAKEKLINKNLDMIIANNPDTEGAGFGTDTNVAYIIDKNMNVHQTEKISKFELANKIFDILTEL